MTHPENLFETASYELNRFRERRMADRRLTPRNTPDRRASQQQANATPPVDPAAPPAPTHD